MQRHRTNMSPKRSHSGLGLSRMSSSTKSSHQQGGYSRKRSHSPAASALSPSRSPHRKLSREYDIKPERYHDSRKDYYDSKRDMDLGSKSTRPSDLKYKSYTSSQGVSGGGRPSYNISHESRDSKSSISRERPMEQDHRLETNSSRREPSPQYANKELPKSYSSSSSMVRDKRYYDQDKSYDSRRAKTSSFGDSYSEKELRGRERSLSPMGHYGKSSDKTSREPSKRVYSREDLEKITVDIRRNVKDPSPTRRAIINPDEVKIVRRNSEGAKPLFDREEIRNSSTDLREDAMLERRVISVKPTVEERDVGRIRAHRDSEKSNNELDILPYAEVASHASITLSQRWQTFENRKSTTSRSQNYFWNFQLSPEPDARYRERSPEKMRPVPPLDLHRGSRDRYKDRSPSPKAYSSYGLASPTLSRRKDDDYLDDKKKYSSSNRLSSERKGYYSRDSSSYRSASRGASQMSNRSYDNSDRDRDDLGRTSSKLRSLSREREKLPDFSQRPDRFKYNNRLDKPDSIPKGSNYYEVDKNHDDRNRPNFRARGRGRGFFRPRGFQRGYSPRGTRGGRGRGNFREFRGRNYRNNRGNYNTMGNGNGVRSERAKSPSHWEHDLFNKMSPTKSDDAMPSNDP